MTQHDRYGEVVDLDTDAVRPTDPLHDPRCRNGWLGADTDDTPIPCLHCRPHLATTAKVIDCDPERQR